MEMKSLDTLEKTNEYLKEIKIWHIVGAIVIFSIGALWHFIFEWTGDYEPIGWFFPVNESVWEHVKLMFWPAFLYYSVEAIFLWKKSNNFVLAKTITFYFTPIVNIVIFYTYTGISGWESFIFDTVILGIVTGFQQYISYKLLTRERFDNTKGKTITVYVITGLAVVLLAVLLVIWTYYPLEIPLLRDGPTGEYGIVHHEH